MATVLTGLLLQATLVAPIMLPVPVSLPAVLVAVLALLEGPGTGMAFGFGIGLLADLASQHPAGTFALTWMLLGLCCGVIADPGAFRYVSVRAHAALAALAAAVASTAATVLLALFGADGASLADAVRYLIPTALGDVLLALAVAPVVRLFLRSRGLQRPSLPMLDLIGGAATRGRSVP
jgi:cell shape-determining protein MreD